MSLKDWVAVSGPFISFVGALLGAWLGATLAGRNERHKLFRERRVNAVVDLMASVRSAIMWTHSWAMHPTQTEADKRNEATELAWSAYHRVHLLGPAAVTKAVEEYWQEYQDLAAKITRNSSDKDLERLLAMEAALYLSVGPSLQK